VDQYCTPIGKRRHARCAGETQPLKWPGETTVKHQAARRKGVSPYDGTWSSWGTRRGKSRGLEAARGTLLKQQGGRCTHCRLYVTLEDTIELPHADGHHNTRPFLNLRLLHRICHDLVHGKGTSCPPCTYPRQDVRMTRAISLRSRVPRKRQARFWRPVERGDPSAEFNGQKPEDFQLSLSQCHPERALHCHADWPVQE
jgi:hypothetical protein